jgi:hypothetical protein
MNCGSTEDREQHRVKTFVFLCVLVSSWQMFLCDLCASVVQKQKMNKEQNAQVCDARDDDHHSIARYTIFLLQSTIQTLFPPIHSFFIVAVL